MGIDRVIPFGKHPSPFYSNPLSLFRSRSLGCVILAIQAGPAVKTSSRARGPDEFQDRFVGGQRLSGPVGADQTEHAMVDRIPLRSSRWIMGHSDDQAALVRQTLQSSFPFPFPMVVGPAAIHLDQQMLTAGITVPADLRPPATNRRHDESRSLLRHTKDHVASGLPYEAKSSVLDAEGPCRVSAANDESIADR